MAGQVPHFTPRELIEIGVCMRMNGIEGYDWLVNYHESISPQELPAVLPTIEEQVGQLNKLARKMRRVRNDEMKRGYIDYLYERYLKIEILFAIRVNFQQLFPDEYTIVFVWDLEYVTLLSERHLREISENIPLIDGIALDKLVENVSTSVGFENPDAIAIKEVVNIEDGLLANNDNTSKFQELKNLYTSMIADDTSIISQALLERCGMIEEKAKLNKAASLIQEVYEQRWRDVKKTWDMVNQKSAESPNHKYANVGLAIKGIPRMSAELITAGLSSSLPLQNVYSSYAQSRQTVFGTLRQRFGTNCRLIYITERLQNLPRGMNVGVFDAEAEDTLRYVYNAQRKYLA